MAQMEVLYLPGKEICGQRGIFDLDLSKIIISGERAGKDGPGLHRILREKYGLELEMEAPGYVLALTSVMDTEEGFQRLAEALREMDTCLAGENLKRSGKESPVPLRFEEYPQSLRPRQILSIASAMDSDGEETELEASQGLISGEFAYLYPPGIPVLVPGEEITEGFIRQALLWKQQGLELEGLSDHSLKRIRTVKRIK